VIILSSFHCNIDPNIERSIKKLTPEMSSPLRFWTNTICFVSKMSNFKVVHAGRFVEGMKY
jgi:hypothetical protein